MTLSYGLAQPSQGVTVDWIRKAVRVIRLFSPLFEDCVFFLPLVFLAASRTLNRILFDRGAFKNRRIHSEPRENEFTGVWTLDEYPVHKVLGQMERLTGPANAGPTCFGPMQSDQLLL